MIERRNSYDATDTGDYGNIPADVSYISGVEEQGYVRDKLATVVDAHKETMLIAGTAVAIGTVAAGGIALRGYVKRRNE